MTTGKTMSFQQITNQPLAVQLLRQWLAKQTNQPLLFYGPAGAGKRALGLETAKTLNCQTVTPAKAGVQVLDSGPPHNKAGRPPGCVEDGFRRNDITEACGRCLSCKKIGAGKHPDVRVIDLAYQAAIRGEPLEKQQFLRIETVLEERKRLYQTANEGAWKVSVLNDAHRMTPDAANVLLKILEEPPPRTALFLLTPYRDRIFSTLLSRCQSVRFRAVSGAAASVADPDTEALWNKLPGMTPRQILSELPPRPTRAEIEAQIERLLSPATSGLRGGGPPAAARVELLPQAQQQVRANDPPALGYD